jgi:hypothetical protein
MKQRSSDARSFETTLSLLQVDALQLGKGLLN